MFKKETKKFKSNENSKNKIIRRMMSFSLMLMTRRNLKYSLNYSPCRKRKLEKWNVFQFIYLTKIHESEEGFFSSKIQSRIYGYHLQRKIKYKKMINLGRYFTGSLILLPGYGRKTLIPTSFFLYLFLSL